MDDFKIMLRLLAAIYACEGKPFNCTVVDERVIGCDPEKRDRLALKLRKEGFIDGLRVIDGVDGMQRPIILWDKSSPEVTFKGLEYMDSNETFKKVAAEMKDTAVQIAAGIVGNVITGIVSK